MRRIKIGKYLVGFGLAIYVIQNIIFGWNTTPMSEAEETADIITKILIYGGMWFYLLPLYGLYEDAVKRAKEEK